MKVSIERPRFSSTHAELRDQAKSLDLQFTSYCQQLECKAAWWATTVPTARMNDYVIWANK